MMRVISSPSSSTTGFATLIFAMKFVLDMWESGRLLATEPMAVKGSCCRRSECTRDQAIADSQTTPPAIILSEPQLGENIGACARAMANFGLVRSAPW